MKFIRELKAQLAVAAWRDTPVDGWRWRLDKQGEAGAAAWAAVGVGTDSPDWHVANIGEDVFDNKPGFAWYRTTLPPAPGTRHILSFEAVDDNATVYLNGQKLQHHEGYNEPFDVPLDAAWRADGNNEVAVLVQNDKQGGGIKGEVLLRTSPGE